MVEVVPYTEARRHDAFERSTATNLLACVSEQANTGQKTGVEIRHILAEDHCSQSRLQTGEAREWEKLSLYVTERIRGSIEVDKVGALQERRHQVLINVL